MGEPATPTVPEKEPKMANAVTPGEARPDYDQYALQDPERIDKGDTGKDIGTVTKAGDEI